MKQTFATVSANTTKQTANTIQSQLGSALVKSPATPVVFVSMVVVVVVVEAASAMIPLLPVSVIVNDTLVLLLKFWISANIMDTVSSGIATLLGTSNVPP